MDGEEDGETWIETFNDLDKWHTEWHQVGFDA